MESVNQNIDAKTADKNHIFNDGADGFNPLVAELEQLREELAAEQDARLRLAAEYDNYRRRTKQESEKAADAGKRELLIRMLTIADELELAAAHLDENSDSVAEGLKLVQKRFDELLHANLVVSFKSLGEKFNPEIHEAFDVVSGTEAKPETVQSEVRRGYFWNDKLLRPALVIVAQ